MKLKQELSLLREDKTLWGRLDTTMVMLFILGLALCSWGTVFNGVVRIANDGAMPVTETTIPGHIVLTFIHTQDHTPREFIADAKLQFLSDTIRYDFPDLQAYVPGGRPGKIAQWWIKQIDYPIEGGLYRVSIGDIMRWVGSIIFLVLTPISVLVLIPRRIMSGDAPRCFRK